MIEKLKEYARKGVEDVWLIDPRLQSISVYRSSILMEIEGDVVATMDGSVEISRSQIFAD